MLNKSGIPRWHRIKCYCLTAASLEDGIEAQDYVERAESQWMMVREYVSKSGMLLLLPAAILAGLIDYRGES